MLEHKFQKKVRMAKVGVTYLQKSAVKGVKRALNWAQMFNRQLIQQAVQTFPPS